MHDDGDDLVFDFGILIWWCHLGILICGVFDLGILKVFDLGIFGVFYLGILIWAEFLKSEGKLIKSEFDFDLGILILKVFNLVSFDYYLIF